ncbi:anhydro-N-acetylmuramic acid kinase [Tropicimonas isoalkanivorans]|uniref:Anhydro-N-acetylmuramic acid kinase n=1 Tax=Tropicimonas isoalkanivorans TaxID=441112 RepID=A0A1I1LF53_9RHOB|nr:anhydro-N-acetylmuramic acid kinase [Tropicimonas isoalkanivorans]SFC71596.1 anhydro-N-acetylmuramic acid kinase [Tropicimonas isoalkanivorans]
MMKTGAVRVLGTMSGTSLDGVDAAEIVTDGVTIREFGESRYRAYWEAEREVLRSALGRWPGEPGVAEAAAVVEVAHLEVMAQFPDVALAGFHGQTLAHEPEARGTHQVGDGARIAEGLGVPVVWDFRSADVRMGGQGAPLAPAYHFALAKWMKARAPVAFLNLGGVGNLTWVDPRQPGAEVPGALLAFDTGPANAPLNDLMQTRCGQPFDEGGRLAARGEVSAEILERFAEHRYFFRVPPKSLDRNDFAALSTEVAELSDADAAATLAAAAAVGVVRGAEHFPTPVERVLVTGGGRKNPVMMAMIREGLGCTVDPVEAAGLDGDMLEAQAFGYLAVRVARGMPTTFPGTTGVGAAVGGGEISYPPGAR